MNLGRATVLLLAAVGCGASDPPAGATCPAPRIIARGTCVAPEPSGCPAGTLELGAKGCEPAGIPPERCGEGFTADGQRGCEPILPAAPCPAGQMATPGEKQCHPVATCGSGKWGDIPTAGAVQYVDVAFAGTSDGSADKPWRTINEAVTAAAPGATVAIAAGSYGEDVVVDRPLKLGGVCPAEVKLVGKKQAALLIAAGGSGAEVHGLALRGEAIGAIVSGAAGVIFDRLWVHHNAGRGIVAQPAGTGASLTVRSCLMENNVEFAVFASGAEIDVERSLVRDTRVHAQSGLGRGLQFQKSPTSGARSKGSVRGSVVERNRVQGVMIMGSDVALEASVVRDTYSGADGLLGRGVQVQHDQASGDRGQATLRGLLVERSRNGGIAVVASDATIEAVVVRDTAPDASGIGRGIAIVRSNASGGASAKATVRSSIIARSHEIGVAVLGAEATLEGVVVRDGELAGGVNGGIYFQGDGKTPTKASLRGSLVENNAQIGVLVLDADATIESTRIRETIAAADGLYGDALLAYFDLLPTRAQVDRVEIERSARAGVANFGAFVSLADATIACTSFAIDGEKGSGGRAYEFENRGNVVCGCPTAASECAAVSSGIAPPPLQ